MNVTLRSVTLPDFGDPGDQPEISASIYETRAKAAYRKAGTDWLVVYADREHFGNIIFLTGFEPRFEEAFLLLGPENERVLITGNESESYAVLAGLPGLTILRSQSLSLMAQDRTVNPRLFDRFRDAGITAGESLGLVGWKYLEPEEDAEYTRAFFIPAAYVQMLERLVGSEGNLKEATPVLMHPETGLRATVEVDQFAVFEWAATRCSQLLWRIVFGVREGDTEFEAVCRMGYSGDPLNVHTMFASASPGTPVIGLRSATGRKLCRGDGVTTAVGFWGALSSRAGLVDRRNDDFLKLAGAYFESLIAWYETADLDVTGGAVFEAVSEKLAQAGLKSALNPGHLTGHEEWMHSPIRPGSTEKLQSGMPFQIDIIPTPLPVGQALNCEDPVTLGDQNFRNELQQKWPACFARVEARRVFMREHLGVNVKASILPLSSTPLCLPPFWLEKDVVLVTS